MSVAAICISAKCSPAQTSFQAYHIWTLMMCPAARHQWWGIANFVTIPRVHVSMFGHHWSLMDSDSEYVKSPATARASLVSTVTSHKIRLKISAQTKTVQWKTVLIWLKRRLIWDIDKTQIDNVDMFLGLLQIFQMTTMTDDINV